MFNQIPYQLIHKALCGELNASESQKFQDWISESPQNDLLFTQFSDIWKESGTYAEEVQFDEREAYSAFESKYLQESEIKKGTKATAPIIRMRPGIYWLSVAAAFAIILAAYFGWKTFIYNPFIEISTKAEQIVQVDLPDGTEVWLNQHSVLQHPKRFSSDSRILTLQGNAYFEVEKNETKPFIIHVSEAVITVLGTAFEIESLDDQSLVVNVDEGRVSLADRNNDNSIILDKNMRGIYDMQTQEIKAERLISGNHSTWKTGGLSFISSPLTVALEDIAQHYDVQIEFEQESLERLIWTSPNLGQTPLNEVFDILQNNFPIEVKLVTRGSYQVIKK